MEKTITATQARIHFGELLRQVSAKGSTVIVERAGKPLAVVLSIKEYEQLKRQTEVYGWQEPLAKADHLRTKIATRRGDQPLSPAAEMIRQTREERDALFDSLC